MERLVRHPREASAGAHRPRERPLRSRRTRGRQARAGRRRGPRRRRHAGRVPVEGARPASRHGQSRRQLRRAMAAQREWFEKDYYKALGVSSTATDKEIKAAYRKLSKQYHPDANKGSEERFKEISAAYDVPGDPAKPKEYDEVRRLGPAANPFGGGSAGPGGFTTNFRVDDLGDILGGLFNRRGGGGARTRTTAGPRRGDDLETELHLSFLDAVNGITTTVNL